MRAVVMKFGGSSVVDAAAIDRVVSIVEAERARAGRRSWWCRRWGA